MEAISKYNLHGIEYVELKELNELLREMKKNIREGKKPGYLNSDEKQRIAGFGALSHLSAILNKEANRPIMHQRLEKTRVEREAKEKSEAVGNSPKQSEKSEKRPVHVPARYTVWWGVEDQETTENCFCFVRWEDKKPVFSNKPCMAMWFDYKEVAAHVAEQLGDNWEVVDMWPVMTEEERLLRALFRDDDDDEDECDKHDSCEDCEGCDE